MYVCVWMGVYMCVYGWVCICVCMDGCVYVYGWECVYVCVWMGVCVCCDDMDLTPIGLFDPSLCVLCACLWCGDSTAWCGLLVML